jgi:hypothetical protein
MPRTEPDFLAQVVETVSAAGAKGVADSSGELSIASPVEGRVRSSIPDADVVTAPASSNQQSPETVARAAARESSAQPATNATNEANTNSFFILLVLVYNHNQH